MVSLTQLNKVKETNSESASGKASVFTIVYNGIEKKGWKKKWIEKCDYDVDHHLDLTRNVS